MGTRGLLGPGGEESNRKYPWGDEFDPARCNTLRTQGPRKTTPVGAHPDGVSACGCYDMVGNVWDGPGVSGRGKKGTVGLGRLLGLPQ